MDNLELTYTNTGWEKDCFSVPSQRIISSEEVPKTLTSSQLAVGGRYRDLERAITFSCGAPAADPGRVCLTDCTDTTLPRLASTMPTGPIPIPSRSISSGLKGSERIIVIGPAGALPWSAARRSSRLPSETTPENSSDLTHAGMVGTLWTGLPLRLNARC